MLLMGKRAVGFGGNQQLVRLGADKGDFVSIESGLKPGDRIVGSGLFKLRTGMSVVEQNGVSPKTSEAPKPSDS